MKFVGFVDGSRAIGYWEREHRNVELSRSFISAGEKPEGYAEFGAPSYLTSKGETEKSQRQVEAKTVPNIDQEEEEVRKALEPQDLESEDETDTPSTPSRVLRERKQAVDYRKLGNPDASQDIRL